MLLTYLLTVVSIHIHSCDSLGNNSALYQLPVSRLETI